MKNLISCCLLYMMPLVLFFYKPEGDVHWPQWFALILFGLIFFITHMKAPFSVKLFLAYLMVQSAFLGFDRLLTAQLDEQTLFGLRILAITNVLQLLLVAIFFDKWREIRTPLSWGLYTGGLIHACYLIWDQLIMHYESGSREIGLMGNRSIGATFTAVWLFFVWEWTETVNPKFKIYIRSSLSLGLLAICVSNSSISFAGFVLGIAAVWFLSLEKIHERLFGVFLMPMLGYLLHPYIAPRMMDSNVRYPAWKIFYDYWRAHFNPWLGSGGGTFKIYGPSAQIEAKFMEGRYLLWAHNDLLQILFEFGIIGAVLATLVYLDAARSSINRPVIFGGLICTLTVMIGNYPLEIALTSLLTWWIFAECFSKERECYGGQDLWKAKEKFLARWF